MTWRHFFLRGERYLDEAEERRYQAFKARFLEEMQLARDKQVEDEQRRHEKIMNDVYGPHGQG